MFLNIGGFEYSWLKNSLSLTSFNVGTGKVESCFITNGEELPNNSNITINGIIGYVENEMDFKEYAVKCKNSDSETNEIKFKLRITDKVKKGVISYYYKPYSFDTSLNTKYGPSIDASNPSYVQMQEETFIEESDKQPHPDGLNIDFLDDYGVYFEGYLKIDEKEKEGIYNIKISGEGGYWFYLNNEEILSKPGRNKYNTSSIINITLTHNYQFYQLYYVTHNGKSHLELKYKYFSDLEWNNNIPNYYALTNDNFEMKQRYSTYISGQKVNNKVITSSDSIKCKEITVKPELPEGLKTYCNEMESGISGVLIQKVTTVIQEYNVSIKDNDNKIYSNSFYLTLKRIYIFNNNYYL